VSGECRPHFFTPNVVERGDHARVRGDRPLAHLLATIRTAAAPEPTEATAIDLRRFGPVCCSTRLSRFGALDVDAGAEHSMALAYALGWIRVSGGNSVLPIWVHSAIPEVRSLIGDLRERNCGQTGCRSPRSTQALRWPIR